ncbi:MAG: glycoside hydrolase family 2 protein [Anaerolineaceae bacterium]
MSKWEPVPGRIQTRWTKDVDPDCPLPEYPRPQLARSEWMNLNGLWEYAIRPKDVDNDHPASFDGQILVPYPLESALSGVGKPLLPNQRLWYRRTFHVPVEWYDQNLLLHFGAVDWETTVWCNGECLGTHRGGYDPFFFDITHFVNLHSENEILVAVWDPTNEGFQERGKQTLNPGFVFYSAVSGIWQTVWLEKVSKVWIKRLYISTDIDEGLVKIQADIQGEENDYDLRVIVTEGEEFLIQGVSSSGRMLELKIEDARLWSPDDPFLYDLQVELLQGSQVLDSVQSYFAMRQISLKQDNHGVLRLHLNHLPVFQYGLLDQGYWPDGLYTAPTDDALISDIQFCKDLGLNMIRKHIKVEPARWYYHCDRLGMLVWQDMPCGGIVPKWTVLAMGFVFGIQLRDDRGYQRYGRQDPESRENYRQELKAMLDALNHFPSIVVWVPFNEAWGQFDSRAIGEWIQAYDPGRLVDAASGWFDQGGGGIYSIHKYVGPKMPKIEKTRALALSEFGGIGLRVYGHLWQEEKLFAYKTVKTSEKLTDWYLSLMEKLEELRDEGLSAAIYTELTDVEYEINGLLTYDREVMKMDAEQLKLAHKRLIGH